MERLGVLPAAKLLVFRLDGQRFGLNILDVEHIFELSPFSEGKGISFQLEETVGLTVPVVDLRNGHGDREGNDQGKERYFIVVVRIECQRRHRAIGLVADRVAEILDTEDGVVRDSTIRRTLPDVILLDEHIERLAEELME